MNFLGKLFTGQKGAANTHDASTDDAGDASAAGPGDALTPGIDASIKVAFPPGHFYSSVIDTADVSRRVDRIWNANNSIEGIDFNDASHRFMLDEVFPAMLGAYDYPEVLEENADLSRFYTRNSQFSWLDSRTLFVMLRHLRPRRVIEVGSGFSSLLTADVNRRFLDDACHFSCIEPYPREFLTRPILGLSELVTSKVEDVPHAFFAGLDKGDILFIDSSHVSKTGSDVNYLVFEILPRLRPGVFIHIHDIFLPHEYPKEWVLEEGRSWNEQYLIRALLMYSNAFRIFFGASYAFSKFPELVEKALGLAPGKGFGGGSLWIERI